MKKLFVLLMLAGVVFTGCKDEPDSIEPIDEGNGLEVLNKQRSILFYYTATWCGPCGSYGSPIFKSIADNSSYEDLTMIDVHTSNSQLVPFYKSATDSFFVSPALQLLNNLPLPGTVPAFFLNGKYEGSSSLSASKAENIVNAANSVDPVLGVAARATADGSSIKIDTKVEFFKDADATYHLSALILEKDVNFRQAVGGNYVEDFDHKYILKASARDGELHSQNLYGDEAISAGAVTAGQTIEGLYNFEHTAIGSPGQNFPEWEFDASNTAVVIIIWKDKTDGTKEVVNTIMVDVQ